MNQAALLYFEKTGIKGQRADESDSVVHAVKNYSESAKSQYSTSTCDSNIDVEQGASTLFVHTRMTISTFWTPIFNLLVLPSH